MSAIDDRDSTESTLRLVLWNALQSYCTQSLCEFLRDRDKILRTMAAKVLHLRAGGEALECGLTLCASRQSGDREIGAFLLGQLGTPNRPFKRESIPVLVEMLLSDTNPNVRAAAAAALGHLEAAEAIEGLGLAAKDESRRVRLSVAFALGRIPQEESVRRALRLLAHDPDPEVREWARLANKG